MVGATFSTMTVTPTGTRGAKAVFNRTACMFVDKHMADPLFPLFPSGRGEKEVGVVCYPVANRSSRRENPLPGDTARGQATRTKGRMACLSNWVLHRWCQARL